MKGSQVSGPVDGPLPKLTWFPEKSFFSRKRLVRTDGESGLETPAAPSLSSEPWLFCLEETGSGSRPPLRGEPPQARGEPVGWCSEVSLPPVPAPGPVSSQILTTVLTGHAPDCLLGSSLPPFLAGGFALGWARRCLLGALPSLSRERVLSGVCRRAGLGSGCRPPAGVPS